jgi:membrane protein DedA with SNARE-associated domain
MDWLLGHLAQHGYAVLGSVLFLMTLGLPTPGALALITAGTAVAYGRLGILPALAVAVASLLAGDTLLFLLGRHTGWMLLGFVCRLAANPESCIQSSAESFYRRGKSTLVISKFIPGLNVMAPPLAGSMKMRYGQFLRLDAAGAALYSVGYGAIGLLSSSFVRPLATLLHSFEGPLKLLLGLGLAGFVGYRIWQYRKFRTYQLAPRIPVEEVARQRQENGNPFIVDVRSHGYYDANAERIQGSVRIEPNQLAEELKRLPADQQIYLYCT